MLKYIKNDSTKSGIKQTNGMENKATNLMRLGENV